ncbi:hypothetical protein G8759_28655 [Spirosoma aureum]|uniref:Uncharacterized protein n=1 Tax=Spirosoma aureum TaxID=2692134 RepID=A0A6G9AVG1_9BACT|nr:hypothetical protein [Spirosoma aureum]QIP16326.1 hypothetical protein G8759_28655 [Spirosoma aureum]
MINTIRCSLVNYDGGSQALLQQYIRRAGCQELTLTTSLMAYPEEISPVTESDLIFLHLASPEELVQNDLAVRLKQHQGVVITSPFPRQQFPDLFTQPFAFLTEPFSFAQFNKCLTAYCQATS